MLVEIRPCMVGGWDGIMTECDDGLTWAGRWAALRYIDFVFYVDDI
jgi:hypothetical protein